MKNNGSLENFISACDELITCKFLIAETKIQKLLGALASTPQVYELVSECMEQFNRDREMGKAFVQEARGNFVCVMPTEEFKVIALVFCTLADINAGKINFNDFIKRFFENDEGVPRFNHFIEVMIIPFRNLIAEAFGYPKINLGGKKEEPVAEEKTEPKIIDFELEKRLLIIPSIKNTVREELSARITLSQICQVAQRIGGQLLEILDTLRSNEQVEDLKFLCYSLIMAASDDDFDMVRGAYLGLKYACKGVKPIKYLMRELEEAVEGFYRETLDNND